MKQLQVLLLSRAFLVKISLPYSRIYNFLSQTVILWWDVYILKEVHYQKCGTVVVQFKKPEFHPLLTVNKILCYTKEIDFSVFCQYFGLDKNWDMCSFPFTFRGIILHLLLFKHQQENMLLCQCLNLSTLNISSQIDFIISVEKKKKKISPNQHSCSQYKICA